jgi:hypothetical protein
MRIVAKHIKEVASKVNNKAFDPITVTCEGTKDGKQLVSIRVKTVGATAGAAVMLSIESKKEDIGNFTFQVPLGDFVEMVNQFPPDSLIEITVDSKAVNMIGGGIKARCLLMEITDKESAAEMSKEMHNRIIESVKDVEATLDMETIAKIAKVMEIAKAYTASVAISPGKIIISAGEEMPDSNSMTIEKAVTAKGSCKFIVGTTVEFPIKLMSKTQTITMLTSEPVPAVVLRQDEKNEKEKWSLRHEFFLTKQMDVGQAEIKASEPSEEEAEEPEVPVEEGPKHAKSKKPSKAKKILSPTSVRERPMKEAEAEPAIQEEHIPEASEAAPDQKPTEEEILAEAESELVGDEKKVELTDDEKFVMEALDAEKGATLVQILTHCKGHLKPSGVDKILASLQEKAMILKTGPRKFELA